MDNNKINKKILDVLNSVNGQYWIQDNSFNFLYKELNLYTERIYLFKYKIEDINISINNYIQLLFTNNSYQETKKEFIPRYIPNIKIIYCNENIIIDYYESDYDIFIFESPELIDKLKLLITI